MGMPEGKMLNEDMTELIDIPTPEAEAKKEEPAKEEKTPEPEAAKKEEEEKPKEGEPEKEEEEEEEEEEPAKEGEAEPEKEKEEEEEVEELDAHLAEKYKDYGIESEKDLDDVLANISQIEDELSSTKAELETLKKDGGKLKFDSENEEKAYNFIKRLGVDQFGEGMKTFSTLVTLDLEKADPKILLEEQFIHEHPELTRDESLRKFNKDYNKKYTAKLEDFDDEAAYKEALEDLKIDLKADAAKAKRYLAQQQKEFVPKPKEADTKKAEVEGTIQKNIKAYDSELSDFIEEFNTITYSFSDNEKDSFHYKLTKEQVNKVHTVIKGWVGNPQYYDAKGNLDGWNGADNKVIEISRLLFGDDMLAKAYKQGLSAGEIKRAEQIASKKPDRVAKVASTADPLDEDAQWDRILKEKQQERARKQLATR
jgi:hypothetical protein